MADIVNVNIVRGGNQTPENFQNTGDFVSAGGTTLAAGSRLLLNRQADLTAHLTQKVANTAMAWATGVLTVTVAGGHGLVGDTVDVDLTRVTPAALNGRHVATIVDATHYTLAIADDPGTISAYGKTQIGAATDLVNRVATYYAQGNVNAPYILELGADTVANSIANFSDYLTAHPLESYVYDIPHTDWTAHADMVTLVNRYAGTDAKTRFLLPVANVANLAQYDLNADSDVFAGSYAAIACKSNNATQFQQSAVMPLWNSRNPSPVNKILCAENHYLYGIESFSRLSTELTQMDSYNINYPKSAHEAGLSNVALANGKCLDGTAMHIAYITDYVAINAKRLLAFTIYENDNNPTPSHFNYNQNGINVLHGVLDQFLETCVAIGGIETFESTAIPFADYVKFFPADYANEIYAGFQATIYPVRGFSGITLNFYVTNAAPTGV